MEENILYCAKDGWDEDTKKLEIFWDEITKIINNANIEKSA